MQVPISMGWLCTRVRVALGLLELARVAGALCIPGSTYTSAAPPTTRTPTPPTKHPHPKELRLLNTANRPRRPPPAHHGRPHRQMVDQKGRSRGRSDP